MGRASRCGCRSSPSRMSSGSWRTRSECRRRLPRATRLPVMKHRLVTAEKDLGARDELLRREPLFHRPELGTTRPDFERMTAPTFWEVGASGRRYSREYVLGILEDRLESPPDD